MRSLIKKLFNLVEKDEVKPASQEPRRLPNTRTVTLTIVGVEPDPFKNRWGGFSNRVVGVLREYADIIEKGASKKHAHYRINGLDLVVAACAYQRDLTLDEDTAEYVGGAWYTVPKCRSYDDDDCDDEQKRINAYVPIPSEAELEALREEVKASLTLGK